MHEITIRKSGFAEMAFVGQTPWHSLGQRVTADATVEEWAKAAGMDWHAASSPVQFMAGETLQMDDGHKVIYRDDTGARLGIVGKDYKVVQPLEVLEFFRETAISDGWKIHTAGTLQGGARLWAMASNHTEDSAYLGDRVRGNLLLATSLDGSMRTIAAMTAVRVVCANTLRLALSGLGKDKVSVSHRSEFDAAKVKRSLGVARESFAEFMTHAKTMAESPIHLEQAREVLRTLFGQPAKPAAADAKPRLVGTVDGSEFAQLLARPMAGQSADKQVKEHRSVARTMELFAGAGRGANAPGSAGTKWGLFNAVTEFIDHERGRTADTRLTNAWFGAGHEVKTEALQLLTK